MKSNMILDLVGILVESIGICTKNGKLMIRLTLLILLLKSIFLFFNLLCANHYANSLKSDLLHSRVSNIKIDIGYLLGVELLIILIKAITSIFTAIAIILASAMIHTGQNTSLKDLLTRTKESWKNPSITLFYKALLALGYIFIFILVLLPVFLTIQNQVARNLILIILSIPAVLFCAYLAVVWILAFVVSVLEDICGIEALGKAKQLVKGMEIYGFAINIMYVIMDISLYMGMKSIKIKSNTGAMITSWLVILPIWLVQIFVLVVYTIYYYRCKMACGEEVQLMWKTGEYSQVPTMESHKPVSV